MTSGHGRVETRSITLGIAEPMATGFVGSQTFLRIHSVRCSTKTGKTTAEDRFYLSSQPPDARSPEQWILLVRAHWAGVENRNHWCRDATLGEDALRLKNPRAVANLALLRSASLRLLHQSGPSDWLPAKREALAAHPQSALDLILQK